MIKLYIKAALREIFHNKVFSTIHVLGLSTGIAAFVIILLYSVYELSYDNFYQNADQIYRIRQDRYNKGKLSTTWGGGCAAIGPALKKQFPEVMDYGIMTGVNGIININEKSFRAEKMYAGNSSFLAMLPVKMISGVDSLVLKEPFTAVISESTAKKFYGTTDATGRTFKLDNEVLFNITGVFKDVPQNTHFKFEIIISWPTYVKFTNNIVAAWNWDGYYTYILLRKGTDTEAFEKKMNEFTKIQTEPFAKQYNQSVEYILQPFRSIHLNSHLMFEAEVNGNAYTVSFLIIIAFIILIIAWVNYVNLSTVKAVFRSRETAIRKISGASRIQLIRQFLTESFLVNLIASLLAMVIVVVTLPYFRTFTGRPMYLDDPRIWIIFGSVIILGPLLSGLYPALVSSSFKPITIFRGHVGSSSGTAILRKILIVFQFAASVVLVAGTFTVYRQLKGMKGQELGVRTENTIIVRGPGVVDSTYKKKLTTFRSELLRYPEIKSITSSTCVPGNKVSWNAGGIRLVSDDDTKGNQYRIIGMDYDYVDSYGLKIIAGRNFSREYGTDEQCVLFNEDAVRLMGFLTPSEALGKIIAFWGKEYKIIGVLKNYHQESLKENYDAIIFRLIPETRDFLSVTYIFDSEEHKEQIVKTAEIIREKWQLFFPDNPFEYFSLSEHYNKQYEPENQFMTLFKLFAVLAIIIACMGLFGLSWFIIARRSKEIGIRKVQGASIPDIALLIGGDFFRLVLAGIFIAAPVTYYFSSGWLEKFAYRTSFNWIIFILSGLIVLIISAAAISYNVFAITRTNPAQSLREN